VRATNTAERTFPAALLDENSAKDRRRVPRFPFVADVEIIEIGSGTRLRAHTSELSLYGCYIETINALPNGTKVLVRISTISDLLEAPATVVHSQPTFGIGLAFHDVKPHYLPTLRKWLHEAMRRALRGVKP
jgi:PilZ domain